MPSLFLLCRERRQIIPQLLQTEIAHAPACFSAGPPRNRLTISVTMVTVAGQKDLHVIADGRD